MDINSVNGNHRTGQINEVQGSKKGHHAHGAAPKNNRDSVQLSDNVQLLKQALAAAQAAPDTRAEHVKAVQQQVEAGAYQPDPERIADALIKRLQSGE